MNARDSRKARLLVVSGYFPPHVSGSTILTCKRAGIVSRRRSALRSGEPAGQGGSGLFSPPCPVQRMRLPRGYILTRVYDRIRHKALGLWLFRRFLQRQVDKCRPTVILGTMPTVSNVHRRLPGCPARRDTLLCTHARPLGRECPYRSDSHRLARQWERTILTKARRVLCITESQADFYREKHGVTPQLLPHTVTPSSPGRCAEGHTPAEPSGEDGSLRRRGEPGYERGLVARSGKGFGTPSRGCAFCCSFPTPRWSGSAAKASRVRGLRCAAFPAGGATTLIGMSRLRGAAIATRTARRTKSARCFHENCWSTWCRVVRSWYSPQTVRSMPAAPASTAGAWWFRQDDPQALADASCGS